MDYVQATDSGLGSSPISGNGAKVNDHAPGSLSMLRGSDISQSGSSQAPEVVDQPQGLVINCTEHLVSDEAWGDFCDSLRENEEIIVEAGKNDSLVSWKLPGEFLQAVCKQFTPAETKKFSFPDEDPVIFSLFIDYVCSGNITFGKKFKLETSSYKSHQADYFTKEKYAGFSNSTIEKRDWQEPEKAWLLADKLNAEGWRRFAMKKVVNFYRDYYLPPDVVVFAYKNTSPGSALRCYCLEKVIYDSLNAENGGISRSNAKLEEFFEAGVEFLQDFFRIRSNGTAIDDPAKNMVRYISPDKEVPMLLKSTKPGKNPAKKPHVKPYLLKNAPAHAPNGPNCGTNCSHTDTSRGGTFGTPHGIGNSHLHQDGDWFTADDFRNIGRGESASQATHGPDRSQPCSPPVNDGARSSCQSSSYAHEFRNLSRSAPGIDAHVYPQWHS
ncbi:hypothetical protein BDY21DRAFT_411720 [Lineolata rhizophorae]|uniref:Uncharacterized protein n=1 Tax=Lineolata rhizophorae TaxID=578093 RepID=A0A6A6P498_9PEZI|nr:hypothetical protein BDY21DRAFT_411720 [Lineolata rhizophorae]